MPVTNIKFKKQNGYIDIEIDGKEVGAICNTTDMFVHPMDESICVKKDGDIIATFETNVEDIVYSSEGFDDLEF